MKGIVSLNIDGKIVEAKPGEKVLWAALDNGIYIPNLCAIREIKLPFAACRLCFVEIEGHSQPITACTEPVADGMVVHTRSPKVDRLVRTNFELLMSCHPVDCARCFANRACELQKIAAHLRLSLKPRRLRKFDRGLPIDDSSPLFVFDPNKCVLCGKCVWVCREKMGVGAIGFAFRGFNRRLTTFGGGSVVASLCTGCGECVLVCPTGALAFKDRPKRELLEAATGSRGKQG